MTISDTSVIKSITPKYPELNMDTKFIETLFYAIRNLKSEVAELSMLTMKKQQELKELEKKYREIVGLVDIEFEKKEIQEIKETVNLQINNPSDYRNVH